MRKTGKSVFDIVTERILAQLEKGVAPWRKPWTTSMPKNLITKKEYRGINPFLLLMEDRSTPYWLSYRQAASLGGNVKKGERSSIVVFWKPVEKVETKNGEDVKKKFLLLRYYSVFNLDQCEGIANPDDKKTPVNPIEAAEAIVKGMPNPPTIKSAANAWYRPSTDTVGVPARNSFTQAEAYYITIFHELGHSTGHKSRLARPGIMEVNIFGNTEYSREELVAEMTAAMLCGQVGIDQQLEQSAAYLKHWIGVLKGDSRLIVGAAANAQKAADYILGNLQKSEEEAEKPEEVIAYA